MKNTNEKKEKDALGMYRRILRIDRLLSDGTYPTLEELEYDHEIEASRATIYRTLEFMKYQLNAPIVKDPENKGFYYSDKTFRLPIVFTTEQEIIAAATLKNMLPQLEGTPLFDSAKKILELIEKSAVKNPTGSFEFSDGASRDFTDSDWVSNRYVFLDDRHGEVQENIWRKIGQAMRTNKVIEFDYTREYDETSERRKVAPYQVLKSHEDWTLWAKDYNRNDFRLFTMNRITNVKVTEEKFSLPKDFEYSKFSGSKDDVWYNPDEANFKIWLSAAAKRETKNESWGRNQKLEKCIGKDGWLLLFSASNFSWVMKKVLSLAEGAKPLEPKEFVEDYKAHLEKMRG